MGLNYSEGKRYNKGSEKMYGKMIYSVICLYRSVALKIN